MRDEDRIRIAEAFQLAKSVRESVWEGWSEVPFVILLVTPEHEFLIRHPYPSEDFVSLGYDELLESDVFVRPYSGQYGVDFLATFPAIRGVNTVVIGQPENTGKSSTLWVIVVLHEHFHQLQYTRPWYYDRVAGLDLAGDDTSGMWQLNYPFPYEDPEVGQRFAAYKSALEATLAAKGDDEARAFDDYREARAAFRASLSDADYRYMSFQLWQEGISRHTEYTVAEVAAQRHEPLPAFAGLPDFITYADAVNELEAGHAEEMASLDLASWKRVVFYPIGATEGLLLDKLQPGWKERYFAEPFFVERYHEAR